ncbi:MAG: Hsp20/alpha crystallin family protein [Bdellovibrionales bacterium]|nr:Hsp20/alpha crystallin family protein [Bdellovibrionales bacterium]
MKTPFLKYALISGVSLCVGAGSVAAFNKISKSPYPYITKVNDSTNKPFANDPNDSFFDKLFDQSFFESTHDPFKEMDRMQKQIISQFDQDGNIENSYNKWFQKKFKDEPWGRIKTRQDNQYVYLDINTNGHKLNKFDVEVSQGEINISGSFESKTTDKNTQEVMTSAFNRSLPIPNGVQADKYKVEQTNGKITISFPKA